MGCLRGVERRLRLKQDIHLAMTFLRPMLGAASLLCVLGCSGLIDQYTDPEFLASIMLEKVEELGQFELPEGASGFTGNYQMVNGDFTATARFKVENREQLVAFAESIGCQLVLPENEPSLSDSVSCQVQEGTLVRALQAEPDVQEGWWVDFQAHSAPEPDPATPEP